MGHDGINNTTHTILRSFLIIVWWVSVWELTMYAVNHIASNSPFHKIIIYIGLMLIVIGTIGLDPKMLQHM